MEEQNTEQVQKQEKQQQNDITANDHDISQNSNSNLSHQDSAASNIKQQVVLPSTAQLAPVTSPSGPQPPSSSSTSNQTQPNRSTATNKGKSFTSHRSQSSPSSLTTHKFGLRPTPSPPRLIIDHNTGDIIESYPEQPVYLRTYQPLDSATEARHRQANSHQHHQRQPTEDDEDTSALDDSLGHPCPPPLSGQPQIDQYNQLLTEECGRRSGASNNSSDLSEDLQQSSTAAMSSGKGPYQQQQHHRQQQQHIIPPPHSGKIYFAPPVTSGNLFERQNSQDPYERRPSQSGVAAAASPYQNAAFKRALNKLNDSARTDIAIVTDLDDDATLRAPIRQGHTDGESPIRVTATSALKANAILAQQRQHQNQHRSDKQQAVASTGAADHNNKHRRLFHKGKRPIEEPPAIEEFNLYNFCYNFHVLCATILSMIIIYSLVVPLNSSCTKFRPTFIYISIITGSVNLICIVVFTLFWYCNGVTRTLYSNLSSSAFIITIYSILVAINLGLAIVLFFVNTCHFQQLISTHSALTSTLGSGGTGIGASAAAADPGAGITSVIDPLLTFVPTNEPDSLDNTYINTNNQQADETSRVTRKIIARQLMNPVQFIGPEDMFHYDERRLSADGRLIGDPTDQKIDNNKLSLFLLSKQLAGSSQRDGTEDRYDDNRDLIIESHSNRNLNFHASKDPKNEQSIYESQSKQHSQRSTSQSSSFSSQMYRDSASDRLSKLKKRQTLAGENEEPTVIDDNLNNNHNRILLDTDLAQHNNNNPNLYGTNGSYSPYSMSPIEAAWEYTKEQAIEFKRKFNQFLFYYDLKFIGALHALCAICLQYLAMKVAVVRSYYCSPVGVYV